MCIRDRVQKIPLVIENQAKKPILIFVIRDRVCLLYTSLRWKQHGAVSQIMAGRSASDRKRHHSFPYNLLANLFDGTGSSASKTGIRTSMAASGRRKNE